MTHNWLVTRTLRQYIAGRLRQYGRGRLLDVGCGKMPYRKYGVNVTEWVGYDTDRCIHPDARPQVAGEAERLPFDDESFDVVLCTQVLEHVREPLKALKEMHRVLANGGHLILTTDFLWHTHEDPEDNYRFPPPGLRRLVERGGLRVVKLDVLIGFYGIVLQEIAYRIRFVPGTSFAPIRWVASALAQIPQIIGYPIRRLGRPETFGEPVCLTARKP